ncbi:MAG: PhnD/SsuA/transferrin family substrate-binding protein [Oscillospiraceae bacterium]|nr:PhnD/SsuA/transferrin family substrate-binding protein [Oscillospiraceae bacterium]
MRKHLFSKAIAVILFVTVVAMGLSACSANASDNSTSNVISGNSDTVNNTQTASTNTKPITVVWYPNESANDYQATRDEYAALIEQATGRKTVNKLTTDYTIAIESLVSGEADIAGCMGAQGYIQAKQENPQVDILFVNSGPSGTLDDALYYSWLCVNQGQEDNYKDANGEYSIANIQGKKMSFVSNSSTSGFLIPTTNIVNFFSKTDAWKNITVDDLLEGGSSAFFSAVLFGGSHQGSAFNLVSGKADVAAFCDQELQNYVDLKNGTASTAGAVYAIKQGASAPFDKVGGKEFVLIQSTPVLNGPFAYNPKNLSADDIKNIRDLFTSDTVANDTKIFVPTGTDFNGMFEKTDKERFVLADDSWYDVLRNLQN